MGAGSMLDDLQAALRGYGDAARTGAALAGARSGPPLGIQLFPSLHAAQQACRDRLDRPLPLMVVPLGQDASGIVALDLCVPAAERGLLAVVRSRPAGFWEPFSPSLAVLCGIEAPDRDPLRQAPTSFHAFAEAAREARARGTVHEEGSRLMHALERPIYMAESLEEVAQVQERILALDGQAAMDPLCLRLSRAGLDAERWRTIGGERALAGKLRDALRCLHGAVFLGSPRAEVERMAERIHMRAGWGFATRILRLTRELSGEPEAAGGAT